MELPGFVDVSEILRCGVYALLYRKKIVYVGQSKTMLMRIYRHRNGVGNSERARASGGITFDEVQVRPCRVELLDELERSLIAKYEPKYNVLHNSGWKVPHDLKALLDTMQPGAVLLAALTDPPQPRQTATWRRL